MGWDAAVFPYCNIMICNHTVRNLASSCDAKIGMGRDLCPFTVDIG